MKKLSLILSVLSLYGCGNDKVSPEEKKITYSYIFSRQHGMSTGTLAYNELNHIDSVDQLLATEEFEYKGNFHKITMYSSEDYVAIDAGTLKYSLDSLGIIYMRSTSWPNLYRLSSNNDSINDLINYAFAFMLAKKSLRCFHCDEEFTHIRRNTE